MMTFDWFRENHSAAGSFYATIMGNDTSALDVWTSLHRTAEKKNGLMQSCFQLNCGRATKIREGHSMMLKFFVIANDIKFC